MMSVSKRYIATGSFLTAKFADIAKGVGYLGEIRPASGHRCKPLPLLVLFDDLQVLDADQRRHWTVAPGDDKPFMTMALRAMSSERWLLASATEILDMACPFGEMAIKVILPLS